MSLKNSLSKLTLLGALASGTNCAPQHFQTPTPSEPVIACADLIAETKQSMMANIARKATNFPSYHEFKVDAVECKIFQKPPTTEEHSTFSDQLGLKLYEAQCGAEATNTLKTQYLPGHHVNGFMNMHGQSCTASDGKHSYGMCLDLMFDKFSCDPAEDSKSQLYETNR